MSEKKCFKCSEELLVTSFNQRGGKAKGLDSWCKACRSDYMKEYFQTKTKTNEYKEYHRAQIYKYTKKYPEKARAHHLAGKHKSELKKDQCERCGDDNRLHLHHPDYSKPLYVLTLCVGCHERIHHAN